MRKTNTLWVLAAAFVVGMTVSTIMHLSSQPDVPQRLTQVAVTHVQAADPTANL